MIKRLKAIFHISPDMDVEGKWYIPITTIWRAIKTVFKKGGKK